MRCTTPSLKILSPYVALQSLHDGESDKLTMLFQCRTCVAVKELPMRTDVEIELIAHLYVSSFFRHRA